MTECPKCGRQATQDAVVCLGCDFILDASFLGDDIMDVEASRRLKRAPGIPASELKTGKKGAKKKKGAGSKKGSKTSDVAGEAEDAADDDPEHRGPNTAPHAMEALDGASMPSYGADALILGELGDDEIASFHTSDTGMVKAEVTVARMYVGGSIQAVLMPDAIPEIPPGLDPTTLKMTPFEEHVLTFVNAKRPVARIKTKSGLGDDDFQTALAMLADKGFIRLRGRAKKKKKKKKGKEQKERKGKRAAERRSDAAIDDKPEANADASPERTLIADAPSAAELGDGPDDDDGVFGDSASAAAAPSPKDPAAAPAGQSPAGQSPAGQSLAGQSLAGQEHTLITELPPESQKEIEEAADGFTKGAKPSLSYVDSLLSEDGDVFASAEAAIAKDAELGARPKPRARRRPPLPGQLPPEELDLDAEPLLPPARSFGSGTDPTPSEEAVRPEPPPLPGDASLEGPGLSASGEAESFEDLATDVPAQNDPDEPREVDPREISLRMLPSPPMPPGHQAKEGLPSAPPAPGRDGPSPARRGPPPLPGWEAEGSPSTDPGVISLSDMSDVSDLSDVEEEHGVSDLPTAPPDERPALSVIPSSPGPPPGVPGASSPSVAAVVEEPVDDSSVSFEMRRKAEKIFEQAEKDIAAGNVSSAIMNAKLATIYNPVNKRYSAFIEDWDRMQKEQVAASGGAHSRETKLVEQSQDAEARGDYERAAKLLRQALHLAPQAATLHNRLGVLLATRLKRYKEASDHVLKAIDLNPKNLAFKNNLGKILAKEESAIHKMPQKRGKRGAEKDDPVKIRKIRPKLF